MRIAALRPALGMALGLAAALGACSGKKDAGAQDEAQPAERPALATCKPGSAIKDGACAEVVTPQTIAVVAQQMTRVDELAKLLDRADTVSAPIELFGGIRRLAPWKTLEASSDRIRAIGAIADTLDQAARALRAFKGSLGETSARLGNLKGELDRVRADPGAARRIEDVRAQVQPELRAAVEPFAAHVQDAIQNAIAPLAARMTELSALVVTGCKMAKLSGAGDKMKELCAQARDSFAKAVGYMADVKARPAALFDEVTGQLEAALGLLVDAETRVLLDAAQARVDAALRLPPAGTGSGSAAGSGSGSAS
jgi:F0F1-type ATP synthase membrane subunit b/b'